MDIEEEWVANACGAYSMSANSVNCCRSGLRRLIEERNRLAANNAIMEHALVAIIDACDSDDDSMAADPAEIARSALTQTGYA